MPLWGNREFPSGNQKPLFANTSNATSASTIHGSTANTVKNYGNVMGLSAAEKSNTGGHGPRPAHAGWVSQKIGTGPIQSITITNGGQGYNTAGFLIITDTSVHGQGAAANVSYAIANAQNVLQSSSSNALNNTISTLTIVNGGRGFSNASQITVRPTGSNIALATFAVTLGGRAGRVNYETLVAAGSLTGDDPRDNVWFTGV